MEVKSNLKNVTLELGGESPNMMRIFTRRWTGLRFGLSEFWISLYSISVYRYSHQVRGRGCKPGLLGWVHDVGYVKMVNFIMRLLDQLYGQCWLPYPLWWLQAIWNWSWAWWVCSWYSLTERNKYVATLAPLQSIWYAHTTYFCDFFLQDFCWCQNSGWANTQMSKTTHNGNAVEHMQNT